VRIVVPSTMMPWRKRFRRKRSAARRIKE
jgi:hypothetical protein